MFVFVETVSLILSVRCTRMVEGKGAAEIHDDSTRR